MIRCLFAAAARLTIQEEAGSWLNGSSSDHRLRDVLLALGPVFTNSPQHGCSMGARQLFTGDFALQFANVRVNPNALFIKDGPFYSCAGGASAIDLSLSLIEEDFGPRTALNLARELVLHVKRSGDQEQCSEPLQFQLQSCDRFGDMSTWIVCNLNQDLSVDALAQRAAMSRRNFTRLFQGAFGKSPAQFVAEARIAEAQQRLLVPRNSIESIATSLGFRSADVFSLAFERYTGIRPSTYRILRRACNGDRAANMQSPKSGLNATTTVLRVA